MIMYKQPRLGVFAIHTGKYGENGWINRPEEYKILGETEDGFIYEFRESDDPYVYDVDAAGKPIGEIKRQGKYPARHSWPLCIHKSRLIEWSTKPMQTELF